MVMSYFWTACAVISALFAALYGKGSGVSSALMDGATQGIQLAITIAGPLSLWSGIGNLMNRSGITGVLSRALSPVLGRLYPSSRKDPELAQFLSANVCANLLGLGNAATPMGIQAVKRLQNPGKPDLATDEMCRLVVMNTASIQLLPTTVAAVRQSLGCQAPFDILPCVWISSILSVSAGLLAAFLLGRIWNHE